MHAHVFSLNDKTPTYYSLQYPNLLETIPIIQTLPSVLSSIPEIHTLLDAFKNKNSKNYIIKNTPLDNFLNKVQIDYFHYREEKANGIQSTNKLSDGDERLLRCSVGNKNNEFPSTSNLINGCIRFQTKHD